MSAPEVEARLAEIRARAEAATPGPWQHFADWGKVAGVEKAHEVVITDRDAIAVFASNAATRVANGQFIAHARSDVPWLLEQLAAAEARNDAVTVDARVMAAQLLGKKKPRRTKGQVNGGGAAPSTLALRSCALNTRDQRQR